MLQKLKNFFNNRPKSYTIRLSKYDSDLLDRICRIMLVTKEEYIANLVAFYVRPKDGSFRMITKHGLLIDSKGKSIDEYMDKQLSK
jgi:hypothetical protein